MLTTPPGNLQVFPTNAGTVIFNGSAVAVYDLAGKETKRTVFGKVGPEKAAASDVAVTIESTADAQGFEKPQIYFVGEVSLTSPVRALLHVISEDGLPTREFPLAARENFAVSTKGTYFVTYGDSIEGPAVLGTRLAPPVGTFVVYNRNGQILSQVGGTSNPYYFHAVHDNGRAAAMHGPQGSATERVALLGVDGSTVWERAVEGIPSEAIGLSFSQDGEYLIYARHFNDPSRPAQEIKMWNAAGKLAYEYTTDRPRLVRSCGGATILILEADSATHRRFILIDPRMSKPVSEFSVDMDVQDVRARISADGKILYLAVYYLDASGESRVSLEARDLSGKLISQQTIKQAGGSSAHLMFSDYGDGVHWLVPAEDSLWLLKP